METWQGIALTEARAEIARLTAALQAEQQAHIECARIYNARSDEVEELESELDKIRKALTLYGLHKWECPKNDVPPSTTKCTCGFDAYEQTAREETQ